MKRKPKQCIAGCESCWTGVFLLCFLTVLISAESGAGQIKLLSFFVLICKLSLITLTEGVIVQLFTLWCWVSAASVKLLLTSGDEAPEICHPDR